MNKYIYNGPVTTFGRCIANNWKAETYAVSPDKAKSNFIFQFKKQNNLVKSSKIELPGKVEKE